MIEERKIIQIEETGPKQTVSGKRKTLRILLILIFLAGGIFAWFWFHGAAEAVAVKDPDTAQVRKGRFVSTTEASGTVVLPRQVEIVSPEEGYTRNLMVEEGSEVEAGEVLVEIEVPDLKDDLDEVVVDLAQARIELENLEHDYDYEVESLERTILRLKDDIAEAEEDAATMKALAELKSSRESDYEDALDLLESLGEDLEDAQSGLESTRSSKVLALRKQQAAINQLEVDYEIVLGDIEENRIKSPIAGEVLEINDYLYIPGSLIEQSDSLFTVADRSEVYMDFDVYEQYVGLLELGGGMTVTVGTSTMEAEITRIGKVATMDTDGLSAMIEVRAVPLTEQTLTPGASAVATITLSVQDDVLTLPRGSWLTTGGQEYVYIVDGNRAVKTEVVLGEIQGTSVEILSGLRAGDEVITGSYQNYIDQDEIVLK